MSYHNIHHFELIKLNGLKINKNKYIFILLLKLSTYFIILHVNDLYTVEFAYLGHRIKGTTA